MMKAPSLHCAEHNKWFVHYLCDFGGSLLACPCCIQRVGTIIEEDRLGTVIAVKIRVTQVEGETAA